MRGVSDIYLCTQEYLECYPYNEKELRWPSKVVAVVSFLGTMASLSQDTG